MKVEMNDIELMQLVQKDDLNAYKILYERYKKQMVSHSYRFLKSIDSAEDIAQEALLNVYSARKEYQPTAKFSTWIYRICTNLCLNELRKHEYSAKFKSLNEESVESDHPKFELADTSTPNQYEIIAEKELSTLVDKYLDKLPPRQKTAFILKNIQGFSYDEIGETIGASEKSVKSLLNRARTYMCEKLGAKLRGIK